MSKYSVEFKDWLRTFTFQKEIKDEFIDEVSHLRILPVEIETLPSELALMDSLRAITAEGTIFSTKLEVLWEQSNLEYLNLSSSSISVIPKEIAQLKKLEQLNLSCLNIEADLPNELFDLEHLVVLNLHRTELKTSPKLLGKLKNLNRLALTITEQSDFPKEILSLKSLENLDLYGSSFTEVPVELTSLELLQYLSLDKTSISSIPTEIKNMPNLRTIIMTDENGVYINN